MKGICPGKVCPGGVFWMGRKGCKSVGPVNTQMNPGILVRWDASGEEILIEWKRVGPVTFTGKVIRCKGDPRRC